MNPHALQATDFESAMSAIPSQGHILIYIGSETYLVIEVGFEPTIDKTFFQLFYLAR